MCPKTSVALTEVEVPIEEEEVSIVEVPIQLKRRGRPTNFGGLPLL